MSRVSLRRESASARWVLVAGSNHFNRYGELEWRETTTYFADADFAGGCDEARAQALFLLQHERRAANTRELAIAAAIYNADSCRGDDRACSAILG